MSSSGVRKVALVCVSPRRTHVPPFVQGDQLFLDWRPTSKFSLLTVNETAPEPVPEVSWALCCPY
jgi:hypothetical protein